MGYIRHHSVIVTTANDDAIEAAHVAAVAIGGCVSPIMHSGMNGYRSFAMLPDGSKEGWEDSDIGDGRRDSIIGWIDRYNQKVGYRAFDWVEVQFGGDDESSAVTRSCTDGYGQEDDD